MQLEFAFDEIRSEQGKPVNRVYPKESFDLFAGEQLVVVGRYKKAGAAKVVVSGSVGGQPQKFDFPATFAEKSSDDSNAFIEKLWAVRRVGEILDELDLRGKNEELVKELVELSKRHGILTPYTSFMADENTNLYDRPANDHRSRPAGLMEQHLGRRRRGATGLQGRDADARRCRRPRPRRRCNRFSEEVASERTLWAPGTAPAAAAAPATVQLGGGQGGF